MIDSISRQALVSEFSESKLLILFGSMAAGSEHENSDIDLAVLFDQRLEAKERLHWIERVSLITGRSVDLVDLYDVGQPLLNQIVKTGVRLVGSDAQYAKLMMKNVCDQEDFVPLQSQLLKERRQRWIKKL